MDWTDPQVDYEYPSSAADAQGYVSLLQELRAALNNLAASKGRQPGQYQLTIAAPCGLQNMQVLRIAEMDRSLDFWNLMVSAAGIIQRDPQLMRCRPTTCGPRIPLCRAIRTDRQFAGSWSQVTGHQASLYADNPNDPSVDNAVKSYMRAGVASHKLVIGGSPDKQDFLRR